jgi:hypothetical protein
MDRNDGGPAFPVLDPKIGYHADIKQVAAGVSVRDYFAAKAMAAMIGTAAGPCLGGLDRSEPRTAAAAFAIADAMLRARSTATGEAG